MLTALSVERPRVVRPAMAVEAETLATSILRIQRLAPRPHPNESFFEKKRRVSAVAGAFVYKTLRSSPGKGAVERNA